MTSTHSESLTSPRMQVIIDHYSNSWIPMDQEILNELMVILKVGNDRQDRFLSAIEKDNALFCYCVKELFSHPESGSVLSEEERRQPYLAILNAPVEVLIEITERARVCKNDTLSTTSKLPKELKEMIDHKMQEWHLATAAATSLASEFDASTHYVYAVTVFRYLGETLLAWSKPDVYFTALQYYKEGKCNVDEAITREFGFSPHLLGGRLVQNWGLHFGFVNAMQQTPIHLELRDLNYPHEYVRRMGEIGDIAARSVYREYYPGVEDAYTKLRDEMEVSLGSQSLKKFEKGLIALIPEDRREDSLFQEYTSDDSQQAHHAGLSLFQNNRYVGRCSQELQQALKEFYGRIESVDTAKPHLKTLLKDTIPEAGFKECCIYILDQSSMSLIPRYTAGTRPPQAYDSARGSMDYSQKNPVTQAFFSNYPNIDYFDKDNAKHPFVLGPIGTDPKVGVMYLEVNDDCPESDLVGTFRAIATAVLDCIQDEIPLL